MKHKCQNIKTLLEEHLDNDPTAPAEGDLADHLEECTKCRHEVEQELRLRETFAAMPSITCPPRVAKFLDTVHHSHEKSEESIRSRQPASHWWSRLGFPVWQPAALATAAVAIVFILVTTSPDQPITEPTGQKYTQAELRTARQQAESTLLYALGVIHKSEKEAIGGILGEQLPQAIKGSLRKTWERTQGGQG